jgi:hypothetical protein
MSRCSHEDYVRATVTALLKETPERQAELLALLTDKDWPGWRRNFDAEIARQTGAAVAETAWSAGVAARRGGIEGGSP